MNINKRFILFLFLSCSLPSLAQTPEADSSSIDSLKRALPHARHDTTRLNIFLELNHSYFEVNKDSALLYCRLALKLAQKIENKKEEAHGLKDMGEIYKSMDSTIIAISYFKTSLSVMQISKKKILQYEHDTVFYSQLYSINDALARFYFDASDFSGCIKYSFQTLNIAKTLKNEKLVAKCLNRIGGAYYYAKQYSSALKFFREEMQIIKNLQDTLRIALCYINLATNHGMLFPDDTTTVFENFNKCLKIYRSYDLIKNPNKKKSVYRGLSIVHNNFADLYGKHKNFLKGIEHLKISYKLIQEIKDNYTLIYITINLGEIYLEQNQIDSAFYYATVSLKISEKIKLLYENGNVFNLFSDIYSHKKEYQKAYEYYRKSIFISDSIFNDQKSRELGQVEARQEIELQDMQLAQEEEEQARIENENSARKMRLQYMGIFLFLLVIVAVVWGIGKFNPNPRWIQAGLFISFTLTFEFVTVLAGPVIREYSGGEPIYKLIFNLFIAVIISFAHPFFEKWFNRKNHLAKSEPAVIPQALLFIGFICLALFPLSGSNFVQKETTEISSSVKKNESEILKAVKKENIKISADSLVALGNFYLEQKNWKKALEYFKHSLDISSQNNSLELQKNINKKLTDLYKEQGDYKNAYEHLRSYKTFKDSLFKEDKSKDIGKLEARHEIEKSKFKVKKEQETREREKTLEVQRRNNLQFTGISVFFVVLFVFAFLFRWVKVPLWVSKGFILFIFLFLFEFLNVLTDPLTEIITGTNPVFELFNNVILTLLLFPLRRGFEKFFNKGIFRSLRKEAREQ